MPMCPEALQSWHLCLSCQCPSLGVAQSLGPLDCSFCGAWLVPPGRTLPCSGRPMAPLGPMLAESPGAPQTKVPGQGTPAGSSFQKDSEGCQELTWLHSHEPPLRPACPLAGTGAHRHIPASITGSSGADFLQCFLLPFHPFCPPF